MFIALSSRRILALDLSTPHCSRMKHNYHIIFCMLKCWSVHGFIFVSFPFLLLCQHSMTGAQMTHDRVEELTSHGSGWSACKESSVR